MRRTITAAFLSLLFFTPLALADHDYRRGPSTSVHQWARHYAETAMRQVSQNRRGHCNYYGSRWSTNYYDHFNWAFRVSRHQAQGEINRREADLRHCRERHGYYYGRSDRYYGYGRNDYGYRWGHNRGHGRHDDRYRSERYGHDRQGGRHDNARDRGRHGDRDDDRGRDRGSDRRRDG